MDENNCRVTGTIITDNFDTSVSGGSNSPLIIKNLPKKLIEEKNMTLDPTSGNKKSKTPLKTIEAKYKDLLNRLGVNGHDGAIAEIDLLREHLLRESVAICSENFHIKNFYPRYYLENAPMDLHMVNNILTSLHEKFSSTRISKETKIILVVETYKPISINTTNYITDFLIDCCWPVIRIQTYESSESSNKFYTFFMLMADEEVSRVIHSHCGDYGHMLLKEYIDANKNFNEILNREEVYWKN